MVDIVRPVFGEVWAASGEKLAPESTKIQSGWIQEMMPYQYENFLVNRQDVALTYLLQKGVAEWASDQEYTASKSVVQYLGHLYIATSTVTNVLPTVTASWRKLTVVVGADGTIPISVGGTGASTAAQARTNLGLGDVSVSSFPVANGMLVKQAGGVLASRTITGTTGLIEIVNGDGVAGNPTISVGLNVAKTNADASWTTTGSIRLPTGTTAQRGVAAAGRIRFNLDSSVFEGYDGTSWNPVGSTGVFDVQNFSGDGVATEFTLSTTPRSENNTQVYINGIYQQKNTYTLTNETLTFSVAPLSGVDNIEVVTATSITIGTTTAGQTSITDSGNYYNSGNVEGALQEVVTQQMIAATNGSSLVGYDGGTAQDVLDNAKPLLDYSALRAYSGRASGIRITSKILGGNFQLDVSDNTSTDNGGTIIVDALGRRWHRIFSSAVDPGWFGAVGDGITDNTAAYALLRTAGHKLVRFGPGTFIGNFLLSTGLILRGSGYSSTTLKAGSGVVVGTGGARFDGWDIDDITIDGSGALDSIGIEATSYTSKYRVGRYVRINNCGAWAFKAWGGLTFYFYAQGVGNGDNESTGEGGFVFVTTSTGLSAGSVATTYEVGGYAQSGGKYGYRIFRTVNGVLSGIAENFAYALHAQSCSSLILNNFYSEANSQAGEVIKIIDTNVTLIGGRFQEEPNISWVNVGTVDRFTLDLRNRDIKARYAGLAQLNLTFSAAASVPQAGAVDYNLGHLRSYHIGSAAMQKLAWNMSGTTAQRPTYVAGDAGETYFDTTLGKPIWWKGAVWVDGTGTTV